MDKNQKQTWETFQDNMQKLRKKQAAVFRRISEKLDHRRKEKIMNKLKKND